MLALLTLAACSPPAAPPVPLGADEVPNIVLELHDGVEPAALAPGAVRYAPVFPVAEDREHGLASLFTANWAPRPGANTLGGILELYGYQALTTSTGLAPWGLTLAEAEPQAGAGPWLLVVPVIGQSGVPALSPVSVLATARSGWQRVAVVVLWAKARDAETPAGAGLTWDQPGALWWIGPRAPAPLPPGSILSTIDLMPTLLTAARATIPSDADGSALGDADVARKAVFATARDGSYVVRSDRHRLAVAGQSPLPEACPTDAHLTDAAGSPSADGQARAALYAALRGWRARMEATTARDRLGAEHFDRLNAAQGYWQ